MGAGKMQAILLAAMRARREELEEAILARARAISESADVYDPDYTDAMDRAVVAGVAYGLEGIEREDAHTRPIPTVLFAQARQAVRSGIAADVALRQYFAGYTLFSDFVMQAAE